MSLGSNFNMEFPERLTELRKQQGLSQQKLADMVGIHISQIHRYEKGTSQPTLDIIKKLAIALSVSADSLLFNKDERGPSDDLRMQFEAISQLGENERRLIREILEGLILRSEAKRWSGSV